MDGSPLYFLSTDLRPWLFDHLFVPNFACTHSYTQCHDKRLIAHFIWLISDFCIFRLLNYECECLRPLRIMVLLLLTETTALRLLRHLGVDRNCSSVGMANVVAK